LSSLDSCYSLAADPSRVEAVLKVDEDDTDTVKAAEGLYQKLPMQVLCSPRGGGYRDMHLWLNRMAQMARGDWLLLFNDDAEILTQDWDNLLLMQAASMAYPGVRSCMLTVLKDVDNPDAHSFLAIRRPVVDILGHLAQSPFVDGWLHKVMHALRLTASINIEVKHLRGEKPYDASASDLLWWTLTSPEAVTAQLLDMHRLMGFMDAVKTRRVWGPRPRQDAWHVWRRRAGGPEYPGWWGEEGWSMRWAGKDYSCDNGKAAVFLLRGGDVMLRDVEELGGEWCLME
jgi:hypothetical protein